MEDKSKVKIYRTWCNECDIFLNLCNPEIKNSSFCDPEKDDKWYCENCFEYMDWSILYDDNEIKPIKPIKPIIDKNFLLNLINKFDKKRKNGNCELKNKEETNKNLENATPKIIISKKRRKMKLDSLQIVKTNCGVE